MPHNIDPLEYEERLTQAGVPAEQAHVHAEAIGQVKAELETLDERTKSSAGDDKVERGLDALNTKFDRTKVELEAKIDKTRAELEAKIDQTRADLEVKIEQTKWEIVRWTVGIVIAICTLQGFIIVNILG